MFKKISSILIAAVLILGFSFSAFSDDLERKERNELYKQLELF